MAQAPRPLATPADIAEALALLTRLRVPAHRPRGAAAAWAWPVAGVVVALLAGLLASLVLNLGVPPLLAAGLVLVAQVALTGGLHEDGLADTADGFWGGSTPARRLEIMKDSRTGNYGVIALVLALGLRWGALSLLLAEGQLFAPLIAAAVLSRAAMAVLMAALPNARGAGLSAEVGRPAQNTALLSVAAALVLGIAAAGWTLLIALFWLALAIIGLVALARAKIGGQTGDVLGAAQQMGEIVTLIALASLV
jgi:adenosylcobinamide-GDP ribazoletransferase